MTFVAPRPSSRHATRPHDGSTDGLTMAALQRHSGRSGRAESDNPIARFFANLFSGMSSSTRSAPAPASVAHSPRVGSQRAAGLAPPASYGVQPRAPSRGLFSFFGGNKAAAEAELMRSTKGTLRANHVYVVQLDKSNDGNNTASLKGQTCVFSTDANGTPTLRGTFRSSSQPFRGDPYGGQVSQHATADGGYRYPYILDGVYSMSTRRLAGGTRGLPIEAHTAYRDLNKNGRIDPSERQLRRTSLIRFHSAGLGSAGCQTVDESQWNDFLRTVESYGRSGGTYILRRSGGAWT